MKHIAAAVIVLALLPLLFRLIVKLRLLPLVLYSLSAGTVFLGWTEAHPALSMAVFYVIAGLTALSWLLPLLRRVVEDRRVK